MYVKGHKTAAILICTMLMTAAGHSLAADDSTFAAHYTTASLSAQEQTAGNLLNNDRARYNLAPLAIDPALCRIARIKSEDMRDNQYFAHTSPTYGDVRQMLAHFGYTYAAAGENIAHHATIEKAQAAFLSSPGHRKNIMSAAYTKVGLGAAVDKNGFVYLTQIFAR
ncbi:MAG: transporter [Clostridia bacterium]|nr:transporter [Clostridia bacterium]